MYLLWESLGRFSHWNPSLLGIHWRSESNWSVNKSYKANNKIEQEQIASISTYLRIQKKFKDQKGGQLSVLCKVSLKITFISENKKAADTVKMTNYQEIGHERSRQLQAIKCNKKPANQESVYEVLNVYDKFCWKYSYKNKRLWLQKSA